MVAVAEAGYMTLKDSKVSYRHKAILLGALVYLLSPWDGIPDLLPGGFVDDMSVLLTALYSTGFVGKEHLKLCRQKRGLAKKDDHELTEKTPKE